MEWRKDVAGEQFYASRNYNDISETYKLPGNTRDMLDWNLTLRQQRKAMPKKDNTQSAPTLMTAEIRQKPLKTNEHVDGPYHCQSETVEKYQNFANTYPMLQKPIRVSGSMAHTIDWQLNLRDSAHSQPEGMMRVVENGHATVKPNPDGWRRYYSRPQASFDMMKENCSKDNEAYTKSMTTPQDRKPDPRKGAISIATIRDEPMNFRRNPGCEGTQAGQWEHLIHDRRYGHKARKQLGHETTLRSEPNDPNGARIEDTRSEGCIVEMLGKKKWIGHVSPDYLSAPPPAGDPKLHHLSRTRIQSEPDEDNRAKRMNKHPRADEGMSYAHEGAVRKREAQ